MKGFSLIEVLIALFLLSVLILSYTQQKFKIKMSLAQSYYKHLALQQSLSMRDRLKVNQGSGYRFREIQEWQKENLIILPQGSGDIIWENGRQYISSCWKFGLQQCVALPSGN